MRHTSPSAALLITCLTMTFVADVEREVPPAVDTAVDTVIRVAHCLALNRRECHFSCCGHCSCRQRLPALAVRVTINGVAAIGRTEDSLNELEEGEEALAWGHMLT